MSPAFENAKFALLRARTDRELAVIVARDLERGLRSRLPGEAERALRQASVLLPTIYDLAADERARIERQVAELRTILANASARSTL